MQENLEVHSVCNRQPVQLLQHWLVDVLILPGPFMARAAIFWHRWIRPSVAPGKPYTSREMQKSSRDVTAAWAVRSHVSINVRSRPDDTPGEGNYGEGGKKIIL